MLKRAIIITFLAILAILSLETALFSQAPTKQKLQQVLIRLESLYQSKQISYDDYVSRKNKVNALLKQVNQNGSKSSNSKIHFDNAGKPYAFSEADCKYASFPKLNGVIKPKGFYAYPGGGFSKSDNKYYCIPCIKRLNASGELSGEQVDKVYKPVKDIIFDYTNGASYEWCQPSSN